MPPSKKARSEQSRALFRLADRLACLQYPYHFIESPTDSELSEAFSERSPKPLWWQLRDALVFIEDTAVRALEPKARQYLRAKNQCDFVSALDRYVHALLCCGESLFPELSSPVVVTSSKLIHQLVASREYDVSQLASIQAVRGVLILLTAIADVAVRFAAIDCGGEEVSRAHKQWVSDHPRRLVMSTETRPKTPPLDSAKIGETNEEIVASAEPTNSGAQASSVTEEDGAIFALLKPIYVHRGIKMPASTAAAVRETAHFLHAVRSAAVAASEESTRLVTDAVEFLDSLPLFNGKRTAGGKDASSVEFERAAKALRLIYTLDLRDLQDSINRLVGEMQNYTSTCKTDPRLGRVGK